MLANDLLEEQAALAGRVWTHLELCGIADIAHVPAARLPSVRKVVLAPPKLTYSASLPFELAAEMGGIVAESTS